MSNTLSEPGPYDALVNSGPDEPIFPLVGRDKHAPATVLFWTDLVRKEVTAELLDLPPNEPMPDRLRDRLRKCSEAEIIAHEMRRFRLGQPEHDTAPRVAATYSGVTKSAEQLSESERRTAIAEAVRDGREAAYHASEMCDKLARIGLLEPGQLIALDEALERINAVADAHAPKRPGVQAVLPMEAS